MTREIFASMKLPVISELPVLHRSTSALWKSRLVTIFAGILIAGTLIFLIKCIVDRFCSLPRTSRRRIIKPSTPSPKPAEGTQTVDLVQAQGHLDEIQQAGGSVTISEGHATVTSEISFDNEG